MEVDNHKHDTSPNSIDYTEMTDCASISEQPAAAAAAEKGPSEDKVIDDPNIVDWDGPDDPANPYNWSNGRKMLNVALVSLSVLYSYVFNHLLATRMHTHTACLVHENHQKTDIFPHIEI